jgi:hypothetical protein
MANGSTFPYHPEDMDRASGSRRKAGRSRVGSAHGRKGALKPHGLQGRQIRSAEDSSATVGGAAR